MSYLFRTKIVAAVAVLGLVAAAAALAAGHTQSATTLTFQGRQVQSSLHFVDQAPKGESAGDTLSFRQTLYAANRQVGFAEVSGTLLDNKRHDADNLTGSLILKNGTIVLQGTSLGAAATQQLAIVGGTGAFSGAHGQAVITNGSGLSTLRLTFNR